MCAPTVPLMPWTKPLRRPATLPGKSPQCFSFRTAFSQASIPGNAAPTLLLDARRPLEGYLARWAGSCAISMLMDAQAGVTAVLDARAERKQAGAPLEKSKKKITQEINLRYIQQALGRSDLMRTETLSPTGALEPGDHYALSALSYLILLAGAVFFPLFDERARRGFLRRLQSAGGSLLRRTCPH